MAKTTTPLDSCAWCKSCLFQVGWHGKIAKITWRWSKPPPPYILPLQWLSEWFLPSTLDERGFRKEVATLYLHHHRMHYTHTKPHTHSTHAHISDRIQIMAENGIALASRPWNQFQLTIIATLLSGLETDCLQFKRPQTKQQNVHSYNIDYIWVGALPFMCSACPIHFPLDAFAVLLVCFVVVARRHENVW